MWPAAVVFLLGMLAAAESSLELPPYFKPCSRNDPNLDECTLKNGIDAIPSILKGDRKYKIAPANPLKITEIRIEGANKGNAPTGLDIIFKDLAMYGLDHVQLTKAHFDLQRKQVEITMKIPDLRLVSQYEVNGKILLLPLTGKGNGFINMTDVDIDYTLNYELVTKEDGLEYMNPRDQKLIHNAKHMQIYLDNLFNGDKTLGENTNKFINENWQVLNAEIGPYIAQGISEAIKQIIVNTMDLIAYKDIFPEKV